MFNISSFLDKFSKNIVSDEIRKKSICEIFLKHTGIDFPVESLEIKDYILFLDVSPTLKNKIFTSKKAILNDIALLRGVKIVDIK